MNTFVFLSSKKWHDAIFAKLAQRENENWIRLTEKEEVNLQSLKRINPDKIFIPHWSHIIAKEIHQQFESIVFHMTDLPYGRGGSPLQNLIIRGHQETKISAIRIDEGIDTGPVYLKKKLSLAGSAKEIFARSAPIIHEMIVEIIDRALSPLAQEGKATVFKRRTPDQSNLQHLENMEDVFNTIRMLDCEGYPPAYIETDHFKIDFFECSITNSKEIKAHVRITKK